MIITQELLDYIRACSEGSKAGIALGLLNTERSVCYQGLIDNGHKKYADWLLEATGTLEVIKFTGGVPTGKFATANEAGSALVTFENYDLAKNFQTKKITNIFEQNSHQWFSIVLEEPISNSADCRWVSVRDFTQVKEGSIVQIFDMFEGRYTRFNSLADAELFRNKLIYKRMTMFKTALFKEYQNPHGDRALELVPESTEVEGLFILG
jgi:hypothetical protein